MQTFSKVLCRVSAFSKPGDVRNWSLISNSCVRHYSVALSASGTSATGASRRCRGSVSGEESKASCKNGCEAQTLQKFLLEQGLSASDCERFLQGIRRRCAARVSDEDIISLIRFLKGIDIGMSDIMALRDRMPLVFIKYFTMSLVQKLSVLESMGMHPKNLRLLVLRNPRCLSGNVDKFLARIDYLRNIPLVDADVSRIICKYPTVLGLSMENNIQPKLQYFRSLGLTSDKFMRKLLVVSPRILGRTRTKIFQNLDLLQEFNFTKGSAAYWRAFAFIVTKDYDKVKAAFRHLLELGFTQEQAKSMIVRQPSLLVSSIENMSRKVTYLVEVIKRPLSDVVKCPTYIAYSLERRIRPRHEAFVKWKAQNGKDKQYSMTHLFNVTDKQFCKRFHNHDCRCCQPA